MNYVIQINFFSKYESETSETTGDSLPTLQSHVNFFAQVAQSYIPW